MRGRSKALVLVLTSLVLGTPLAARAAAPEPFVSPKQGFDAIKAAIASNDFETCIEVAQRVGGQFSDSTMAWFYAGRCQADLGRWCEADRLFLRFLEEPGAASPERLEAARAARDSASAQCLVATRSAACEEAHRAATTAPSPEAEATCVARCGDVLYVKGQGWRLTECQYRAGRCEDAQASLDAWRNAPGTRDDDEAVKARFLEAALKNERSSCRDAPPDPQANVVEPEAPAPIGPEPVVPAPDHTPAWVLVIGGGAAAALGIVGYVVSDSKHQDFEDARLAGGRSKLTEAEGRALAQSSDDWWLVGTIATGVGAAAIVTGIVLFLAADGTPEPTGQVHVTGFPTQGGAGLGLHAAF